jgi:hypothetical protein
MKTIGKIILGFLCAVFIAVLSPIILLILGVFLAVAWACIEVIFVLGLLWLIVHFTYEKLFKNEIQKTNEQSGDEVQNV